MLVEQAVAQAVKQALIGLLIVLLNACAANSYIDRLDCKSCQPPDVDVRNITREALYQQLQQVPLRNGDRAAELVDRFERVGCRGNSLKLETHRRIPLPNIICELTGSTDRTIVIGAHYDKSPKGRGVVDNWTGVALLPLLYQHLREHSPRHTFLFIGFAEEELNLVGSKIFVGSLSAASLERIVAMVNLDTFGLTTTLVDPRSASHLVCKLIATAESLQLPFEIARMRGPISGDWEPFRNKGVPILNLHSITRRGLKIVHTSKDRLEAVDQRHYYDTYRLVHSYLKWLDDTLVDTGGNLL